MKSRLLYGTPEKEADLLYATRFAAPDPVLLLEMGRKKILMVRDLEIGRARQIADVDSVVGFREIEAKLAKRNVPSPKLADFVHEVLKNNRVRAVVVPNWFPAGLLDGLRARKVNVRVQANKPFYPQRAIKTPWEVKEIIKVQRATEAALNKALVLLRAARIDGKRVKKGSRVVTSKWLKEIIHQELLHRGCLGEHTIVAIGEQAVEPHHEGEGPVVPNQTIVFDVFPRSEKTHYYADLSRTVVKGKASPQIKNMYQAVLQAQQVGLRTLQPGVRGSTVHKAVAAHLQKRGFKTFQTKRGWEGFTHGTGHGVGLDIHELPGVGRSSGPIPTGSVVTVEPGLYYRDVGGVRLEDMALVTKSGARNLTRIPKFLEV